MNQLKLLTASYHALRSYQYGNSSPDLARELADELEKYLGNPSAGTVIPPTAPPLPAMPSAVAVEVPCENL